MDAYELLSKRNHIHKYKEDKIPPKELIDDLLYKAWKTTPSKNSAMAYTVYVYGPNSQNYKDICHQMCHRNHIKAEMKAVQEGLQDMTQGGKLNPDYAHIANAPWLFGVHSRVLKQMNPYYQRQEKQGHFADQRYEKELIQLLILWQ